MKIISDIGIQIPQVYLPKSGVDFKEMGGHCLRPIHLRAGVLESSREDRRRRAIHF